MQELEQDERVAARAAQVGRLGNHNGRSVNDEIHVGNSLGRVGAFDVVAEDDARFEAERTIWPPILIVGPGWLKQPAVETVV